MAKKSKKPKKKNRNNQQHGNDEFHFLLGGVQPSDEFHQLLTDEFQRRLRESTFFDDMVRQFGQEEAENFLKQCKVEPGGLSIPEKYKVLKPIDQRDGFI
jgi:hypothetical protein